MSLFSISLDHLIREWYTEMAIIIHWIKSCSLLPKYDKRKQYQQRNFWHQVTPTTSIKVIDSTDNLSPRYWPYKQSEDIVKWWRTWLYYWPELLWGGEGCKNLMGVTQLTHPGTLQTAIPISPAAFISTLSTPLPIRTITLKFLNFSKSSLLRVIVYHMSAPTASVNTWISELKFAQCPKHEMRLNEPQLSPGQFYIQIKTMNGSLI